MLSDPLTLTFLEADGTTERTEIFDKKTEDANIAIYNNRAVVQEPSLPMARLTYRVVEAKPSGTNLGVQRTFLKIRHEVAKETPAGIVLLPIIEEFNTSSPVQFTRDEKTVQYNRVLAALNSIHTLTNYLEGQC